LDSIIELTDLVVSFRTRAGSSRLFQQSASAVAVDRVSLSIRAGDTFGLAGETGSGKSTIAKVLVGLYRPASGTVRLLGEEIDFSKKKDVEKLRRNVGIVFQDPVGSLNPRLRVREIIKEALIASGEYKRSAYDARISRVVEMVGLRKSALESYGRDLSGGEKQRVSLARAIVVPKKLLVLDEPTSSLDVSVQAQVLNTLRSLKSELQLSYLFITHDLNVMKYVSDRLGILYYGRLVEVGDTYDVVTSPKHPYTSKLIANLLSLSRVKQNETGLDRGPSSTGCIYSQVCPFVYERCAKEPAMYAVEDSKSSHYARCFLFEKREDGVSHAPARGVVPSSATPSPT
jgi:oligopeptide/dipeptide ABC transporter ATP-binding protein